MKKGEFLNVDVYSDASDKPSGYIIDDNYAMPKVTQTKKLYEDHIPLEAEVRHLLFYAQIEGKFMQFEVEVNNFASLDQWQVRDSDKHSSEYLEIIRESRR